uniref:Uncharacterized protein n=1 Tax=Triticum urartu TaxID=4572 RepID=A0A8R7Q1A9_TRIUA
MSRGNLSFAHFSFQLMRVYMLPPRPLFAHPLYSSSTKYSRSCSGRSPCVLPDAYVSWRFLPHAENIKFTFEQKMMCFGLRKK